MSHPRLSAADASTLLDHLIGSEPVQAHVVLLQALRAEQDTAGVRREQAWLARHHGQAIAEVASMQVWQPLNVHDIATEATSVRVSR